MAASPFRFLRAGPPPPKVVLLPDGLFFSRSVSITPGATPAEAASQIELALEAIAPFPLAQLYYGWFWTPGAETAFVYAAYRRRFTTEQTAAWGDAELVMPISAALFGAAVQPATTILLSTPEGLTAIHWDTPQAPSRVVFRAVDPEATEDDRAQVRESLLRGFGGTLSVIDLLVPPVAESAPNDRELVFRSGDFVSRIPAAVATSLDVRDKAELVSLRSARKRDLILWRVAMGCAAALVLLLLGELALLGGKAWQNVRVAQVKARAPTVDKIRQAQELATNIHDLVTKRFLPVEMLTTVVGENAERKPGDLVITSIRSAATAGNRTNTIYLELQTTNSAQVPAFRNELQKLSDLIETVNVEPMGIQGDRSLFRLTVTFKPGALKPDAA